MDANVGGSGLDMKEIKSKRKIAWKGAGEIEEVCGLFTVFLTTPTAKTYENEKNGVKDIIIEVDPVAEADK